MFVDPKIPNRPTCIYIRPDDPPVIDRGGVRLDPKPDDAKLTIAKPAPQPAGPTGAAAWGLGPGGQPGGYGGWGFFRPGFFPPPAGMMFFGGMAAGLHYLQHLYGGLNQFLTYEFPTGNGNTATKAMGEDGGMTTHAMGEEGGGGCWTPTPSPSVPPPVYTTMAMGEEGGGQPGDYGGPISNARLESGGCWTPNPVNPGTGSGMTTMAVGEEGGNW